MNMDERNALLAKASQLRLTDLRDGMDWVGLHTKGSVDPEIRPVFRARMCGFARTIQYVPTDKIVPAMTPEEYTKYAYEYWYGKLCNGDWEKDIVDGDVIVFSLAGRTLPTVGLVGSLNLMGWAARGARGCVTNGGARDTDEIIREGIPVFSRYIGQAMYQGRVEEASHGLPVEIGGVLVRTGDLVVGDGDGVLVIPIDVAEDVVKYAIQESEFDKKSRKKLYQQLGIPEDETLESRFSWTHPYDRS